MGEHNASVLVHHPVQLQGRPVVSIRLQTILTAGIKITETAPYQLVGPFHANISGPAHRPCSLNDVGHHGTREEGSGHTSSAPRESLGLANLVLLLAPITGAYEGDGGGDLVELLQDLLEGEDDGVFDHPVD
jgi:hypothetical protein